MELRNEDGLTEKEFLEQYNPRDYDNPSVTVDIMALRMKEDLSSLQILLIQRKNHPYIENWALPGGFINIDESAYDAACRELKEETNLSCNYMEQMYTMTQPDRDPRMRVISIVYLALLPYGNGEEVVGGDDAKSAVWCDVSLKKDRLKICHAKHNIEICYRLDKRNFVNRSMTVEGIVPILSSEQALAFDHDKIVYEGLTRIRNKAEYSDVVFGFMESSFTLPDLQKVYEIVLDKKIYKKNFRDKVLSMLQSLDRKTKPISGQRPAMLYEKKNRM